MEGSPCVCVAYTQGGGELLRACQPEGEGVESTAVTGHPREMLRGGEGHERDEYRECGRSQTVGRWGGGLWQAFP